MTFKTGDKVNSIHYGKGVVISVSDSNIPTYPVVVQFDNHSTLYTYTYLGEVNVAAQHYDGNIKLVERPTDHTFSKEVQDALMAGKAVWFNTHRDATGWRKVTQTNSMSSLLLLLDGKWSLTLPKVKIKKWQWVLKNHTGKYDISTGFYATRESTKEATGYSDVVEPYLPSEIEVEIELSN